MSSPRSRVPPATKGGATKPIRTLVISALIGLLGLLVSPAIVVIIVALLFPTLPQQNSDEILLFVILIATTLGGAVWGYGLARLIGTARRLRFALAGALAYGPSFFLAAIALENIERAVTAGGGLASGLATTLFQVLFPIAVLLVAGIAGASLGVALGSGRAAGVLALAGGVSAAVAFIAVVVIMRWMGWRVGNIDFPSRDTMQTVMGVGMGAVAIASSAVLGLFASGFRQLVGRQEHTTERTER